LKAFFTITLLLILGFSQVGYYFVQLVSQHQLKENMEEAIHNSLAQEETEAISYTDNAKNIFWEEEGKEFLFNGTMYDVVKIAEVKGKKILYCINDKKEKQLVDKYSALTKNNSGDSKKQKNNAFQSEYFFTPEYKDNDIASIHITPREIYLPSSSLAKGICNKNFPPPKA
jgi:hypothetical protein